MSKHLVWTHKLADDPTGLLDFNAPQEQVRSAVPAGVPSTLANPPLDGLLVAPDQTDLPAVAHALETGDTGGLPGDLADQVTWVLEQGLFRRAEVPGAGGDLLDAALWVHPGRTSRPALVMPAPWADMGWLAYAIQGLRFALKGYNVLAYTARGFGRSGGQVEVAGEADVTDGTKALDFLIRESGQPPTKVGFLGDSYGSGISQLVAAMDKRVDAVVALSTWGDLGQAFYENGTRHVAAVRALLGAAKNARLSKQTQKVFDDVLAGESIEETLEWARQRSPLTHVSRLNSRKVPVFFSHAWHETLFPANQTLEMFHRLTGPKRMNLSIGDHSGPEMSGILGLPNRIWYDAHRWLDHFLMGEGNGIEREGQVLSQIMWSRTLEAKPGWDSAVGRPRRLYLTAPQSDGDGGMSDSPSTGWNMSFQTGANTVAEVADTIIQSGYSEMLGRPKVYPTHQIQRSAAAVWSMSPDSSAMRLRGLPHLHLTFTSGSDSSGFVAYLFDCDADGSAHIITHSCFTAPAGASGRPVTADVPLQATGYDLRPGHRLMLVLDSADKFYADSNIPHGTLTFTSPQNDPSYLDISLA